MRLIEILFVGFRFFLGIKKNKSLNLAALVAAFSICIGVATITIATSIINGFEYAILKHTLGVTSDIVIFYRENKPNWETEEAWLKSQENVQAIEPFIRKDALIESGDSFTPVIVEAVYMGGNEGRSGLANYLDIADIENNENNIILGKTLLDNLKTSIGKALTLITTEAGAKASKMIVSGFFKIGLHEVDSRFIIMSKKTAQNVFQLEGHISGFRVYLEDPSTAEKTASTISDIYGDLLAVYPWTVFNQQFFLALKSQKRILFVILSLIIFVASFNIATAVILATKEKKSALGFLRSMGANPTILSKIIITMGSMISIVGVVAGLVLGVSMTLFAPKLMIIIENLISIKLINPEIYFVDYLPIKIKTSDLFAITITSLAIAFAASYVPSKLLTKIKGK
ncbi:MAG: hypothetical protein CBC29_01170 [Methylococcaceae bacterium TMED69]|nr:MAG: hypothetical protein CBC29_01170 [Methylococcaceae bacterium TMED69]